MASTDPNFGLSYGWAMRESGWNTGVDANFKKLGAIVQLSVLSILNDPPATPTNGDRYIIGVGTGAWAAKDNQIAVRVADAWEYYTPGTGWVAYNQATDKLYAFDVAWNVITGGGDTDLNASPAVDHTVSGVRITLTAGEALAFGDPCRIASTGKVVKAAADVIANAGVQLMCAADTIAEDAEGYFLVGPGIARDDSWNFTVGGILYLSTTGTITQSAPSGSNNVVQVIGVASATTKILFRPELTMIEVA